MNIKKVKKTNQVIAICFSLFVAAFFTANAADVNSVTTGRNASGAYEIQLGGKQLNKVSSYSLNNPARIIVDIPNAKSNLAQKVTHVDHSLVSDVVILEGQNKVRVTINLNKATPYEVVSNPNKISIALKNRTSAYNKPVSRKKQPQAKRSRVAKVDFQRGSDGQGKILIRLPNDKSNINIERVGQKIIAKLHGSSFGRAKQLNVIDFGTPVKTVDVLRRQLSIVPINDQFEVISYQNDKTFTIELARPSQESRNQDLLPPGDSKKQYDGESLSLNFQDIEVRAVLQLIGDFTNTNIVVSDEVSGSITLRLNNVPWDQALDIILQTKGLSMQKNGSVMYIAPSETIAANKKAAYNVSTVEQELAPIQQQLIQIQYARAEDIKGIIDADRTIGDKVGAGGLLSSRGSMTVDPRTNTLIVNDVPSNIGKVRRLITKLDVAVSQVMIDARLVVASNDFAHELGVAWTGSRQSSDSAPEGKTRLDRLGVGLGLTAPTTTLAFQLLNSDFLLDLELSALQSDGRGEVISSPRVITQDGHPATIKQGIEIPYTPTSGGVGVAATVSFKKAELSLEVTPKIAPNNMIDMILDVKKDTVNTTSLGSNPAINTNSVSTKVLVDNGETVVLGGVYEQTKNNTVSKVPLLGDIPIIGRAFRKDTNSINKNELLIFVTPRIVDKRYISRDKFSTLRK